MKTEEDNHTALPQELREIILSHVGGPWRSEEYLQKYHARLSEQGGPGSSHLVPTAFPQTRNQYEIFAVQCNRKVRPWEEFFSVWPDSVKDNERQTFLYRALPYLMDLTDVSPEGKGRLIVHDSENPPEDDKRKKLRMGDNEPVERMLIATSWLINAMMDFPVVLNQLRVYIRNPGFFLSECFERDRDDYYRVNRPDDWVPNDWANLPIEQSYFYSAGRFFDLRKYVHNEVDPFEVWSKELRWVQARAFVALGWQNLLPDLIARNVLVVRDRNIVKFLEEHVGVYG